MGHLPSVFTCSVVYWQSMVSVLVGWDSAALFLAGSTWGFLPFLDAAKTREVATREESSIGAADLIIVVASVVSLVGVLLNMIHSGHTVGALHAVSVSASVVTVVLSWLTVHTLFVLRYARLYYGGEEEGGVDFQSDEAPDYMDFVYLSFTLGMTYQVSDTNITERTIRRAATRHALLSYLFGTVIVGVTINVLAGLIK